MHEPILFEDKMKYRDNEFLYDKCIKQHDCIMNYQWKMRGYKDRINKAIELLEDDYFEDGSGNNIDKVLSILRGEDNG